MFFRRLGLRFFFVMLICMWYEMEWWIMFMMVGLGLFEKSVDKLVGVLKNI